MPADGRRSLLKRPFDLLICIYYGVQIPMALLLDSQAVLPRALFPDKAVAMNDWYIQQYRDPLVSGKPNWFIGCGYFELLVQVPFFAIAIYGYAFGRQWIHLPNLVFSSASAAILIPIMSELILSEQKFEKLAVLSMYTPFAVMPTIIAAKTFVALRGKLNSAHAVFAQGKNE